MAKGDYVGKMFSKKCAGGCGIEMPPRMTGMVHMLAGKPICSKCYAKLVKNPSGGMSMESDGLKLYQIPKPTVTKEVAESLGKEAEMLSTIQKPKDEPPKQEQAKQTDQEEFSF